MPQPSPFSKNQSLSAVVEGLEDAIRSRPGITATEVGVLLRAVARSQAAEALAARSKEDGFHAEDWVALVQGDLCPNGEAGGGVFLAPGL